MYACVITPDYSEYISRNSMSTMLLIYFKQEVVWLRRITQLICEGGMTATGNNTGNENCLKCIKHELLSLCKIVINYESGIDLQHKICYKYFMFMKIHASMCLQTAIVFNLKRTDLQVSWPISVIDILEIKQVCTGLNTELYA